MDMSDVVERLFPGFTVQSIDEIDTVWFVTVRSAVQNCACPSCNHVSHRIHSQYSRTPMDLSWCGQAIHLKMGVFRFFCDNQQCTQRIFCQRHADFLAPHAQA